MIPILKILHSSATIHTEVRKIKPFRQSLRDGFDHITNITDVVLLRRLRQEGVQVDLEGYYTHAFGDHKEYELSIEPIGEDGQYQIALYKNRIQLIPKLSIWTTKKEK